MVVTSTFTMSPYSVILNFDEDIRGLFHDVIIFRMQNYTFFKHLQPKKRKIPSSSIPPTAATSNLKNKKCIYFCKLLG